MNLFYLVDGPLYNILEFVDGEEGYKNNIILVNKHFKYIFDKINGDKEIFNSYYCCKKRLKLFYNDIFKISCKRGYLDFVKLLLKYRVDYRSGINLATENNHLKIVKELLKCNGLGLGDGLTLRIASVKNNLEIVKELLKDKRVDPSHYQNSPIILASRHGSLEVVKELLKDERVDPGDYNNQAIIGACRYGHLEVVKELLKDERVDPNGLNNFPIKIASKRGYVKIVNLLLDDERTIINRDIYIKIRSNFENIFLENVEELLNSKMFDNINKLKREKTFLIIINIFITIILLIITIK
jgi:hypothetical protein